MPTATTETTCCAMRSTAGAATVAATWTACITASTIGPVVGTATVARASASVISRTIASAAVIAHTAPVIALTIASAAVVAPIPRPGADEHSADKPARPAVAVRRTPVRWISVVAVRRTAVRWISVVAVAAYWRSGNVSRPESDPNTDLGLGVGQRNHQNCQQGHIP